MPEMKRNFAKARMNKDADERTLQNGEYRHALNIQVSTSDTGDVGALQNIKGNTKLADVIEGGTHTSADSDICVGMVKHVSTDSIYYFVNSSGGAIKKDYILEYNSITSKLTYVFVDIYEVSVDGFNGTTSDTFVVSAEEAKAIRPGMTVTAGSKYYTVLEVTGTTITLDGEVGVIGFAVFNHARVLEFPSSGSITGINVLDDTLFWTDNVTEPKRINITRSIAGTGSSVTYSPSWYLGLYPGNNADYHTSFVSTKPNTVDTLEILENSGVLTGDRHVSLKDITVIRKAPTQALKAEGFSTSPQRTGNTVGFVIGEVIWAGSHEVGSIIEGLTFTDLVQFEVGDIVVFSALGGASNSGGGYDIKTEVTHTPYPGFPYATGYKFKVTSISLDLIDTVNDWQVELDVGDTFLSEKFVRFSYRYKYQDGEYSTFAPWSEVAFIPSVYDYFAEEGYNKGMDNRLRNLTLKNYVPDNIPYGVTDIDLLYKETNNPTVYTVKTVKPSEPEYILETDLIHAVVPSNQLLRPWDNIPKKALAQEVSANRLIYGNYVQGFNVARDPSLNIGYSVTNLDTHSVGSPSLKSLREYQVGIVYSDGYGRETPILTNEGSSIKVPVELSSRSTKLEVNIDQSSSIPSWAKYYSFYIKEPTVEYYTMAMDRWYAAADGNVWLSFPSSERNKIDDETFLYLKKAHGNNIPVTNNIKYKVLDISDSAPDYIKIAYQSAGHVNNNETEGNSNIGTSEGGYPLVGQRTISVPSTLIPGLEITTGGSYRIRFSSGSDLSKFYDVDRVSTTEDYTFFHLHGSIGSEMSWATLPEDQNGQSISDNLWEGRIEVLKLQLYAGLPKNRPEFDGRFFVKILNDLDVTNLITSFESDDWLVFEEEPIGYIDNRCYTHPTTGEPVLREAGDFAALDLTEHPNEDSSHTPAYSWTNSDGYDIIAGTDTIDLLNNKFAATFWESMTGKFFIDRCSAFSWSGIPYNFPGSAFGGTSGPANEAELHTDGYWYGIATAEYTTAELQGQASFWNNLNQVGFQTSYYSNVHQSSDYGSGLPSRGMWIDGDFGKMDLAFAGYTTLDAALVENSISEDSDYSNEWEFIKKLYTPGAKFRFKNDPDSTVYTVHALLSLLHPGNAFDDGIPYYTNTNGNTTPPNYEQYLHGHYGIENYHIEGQMPWTNNIASNNRQRWTLKVKPQWGVGPSKYTPTTGTQNDGAGVEQVRALHHDGTNYDAIQMLTPTTVDDDGNDISGGFVRNPAVWETVPKESVDIDIYYQASDIIPLYVDKNTNEDFAPVGTTFVVGENTHTISRWEEIAIDDEAEMVQRAYFDNPALSEDLNGAEFTTLVTPSGRKSRVKLTGVVGTKKVDIAENGVVPYTQHTLTWNNCWSFGNGVESDRIRDDYNAPQMDNGVKASTVLAKQFKEERRKHGLIWSGIYNSTSGVNDTNQFIMAEAITKDLNPSYGSIQRLLNRGTRLVMFCEDKVLRAVTNKDALYNADGNPQLIASNKVIGDVQPYDGNYGISKNPESLAVAPATAYFTDASRGRVLALSTEGVRPISSYGMESYFLGLKNLISNQNSIVGAFDDKTREYNLSTSGDNTVSYSEKSKSWVSFKSFLPQAGISLNNEFYTFAKGNLWKHHSNSVHNNFYGDQGKSNVTAIFSDTQGGVKSFNTVNYEGSKAKVTAFVESTADILTGDYSVNYGLDDNETTYDGEYHNLTAKTGWYMESMKTDLQNAGETEFKEKEGKWFGALNGELTTTVNTAEFSTQGLGLADTVSYAGTASGEVTVTFKNSDGFPWD